VELVKSSPKEFAATLDADATKYDKLIRDLGIKIE
jgi:hypothetical protein